MANLRHLNVYHTDRRILAINLIWMMYSSHNKGPVVSTGAAALAAI